MRTAVVAVLGTATVVGAVAFLVLSPGAATDSPLLLAMAVLVGAVGVIAALVKVAGSGGDDVAAAPWDDSGALVDRAPERSPDDYDLSGERLAGVVEKAGKTARDEGTVAAGVEAVRPHLREALLGVLVQGGTDPETAEARLERGDWTDDATAAAALDGAVDHPGWSLVERFEAWLFPEQLVRREVRTAMGAVAAVADRELPTVPGQHAPRTVPVLQPTLEDLRRGADGHLQRAVDPLGARTGSTVDGASVVDGVTETNSGTEADTDDGELSNGASEADMDDSREETTLDSRERADHESLGDVRIGSRSDDEVDEEVTRG